MKFFKGIFNQARSILRLALPVALAQLGNVAVQVADSAMVGNFGGEDPVPLAAVAFGTSISWLFLFLCI
ncbi:MAG: MATE family efflux transporter, partial [Alistipes sp.]|nr:MATE family efflux transporter [Alistipes sp.]